MKKAAIIAAAGLGKRMGGNRPKQYLMLGGRPIICHTLDRFRKVRDLDVVVVAVEPGREEAFRKEILAAYDYPCGWTVVGGGAVRQASVANALAAIPEASEVVIVHDGVRPFVTPRQIEEAADLAAQHGACIIATPIKETIKRVRPGHWIEGTVDRRGLFCAKTPQCFRRELFIEAMAGAIRDGFVGTDEASLIERHNVAVHVIQGDERNIKITTPSDLLIAEAILKAWTDMEVSS